MSREIPARWRQPIFVASMGRSGSTLLQRVLNVHPDITIWGEHGGFLSGVLQSYGAIQEPATAENLTSGYTHRGTVIGELSEKDAFKPWVSPFLPEHLRDGIRSMTVDLFTRELPETVRWGFKEIRYSDEELRTLMEIFPEAHLIVLARDIEGYATSRFFAFGNRDFDLESEHGEGKAVQRLTTIVRGWMKRYEGLLELHDEFGTRSSVVAYSDIVVGSDRPKRIFEELGELVPTSEAIDAVLTAKSGSSYVHNSAARENRERLTALVARADVDREACARLSGRLGLE